MSTRDRAIYLNNAATGWPKPPCVTEAIRAALETPPFHPGRSVDRSADALTECRRRLGELLGVDDFRRIVLTMHATHAINLAILGLELPPGAGVVTTITEHNSVLRPLNHLKKRRGITVTVIGLDSDGKIDGRALDRALAGRPALLAMSHASNVTGRVNDVQPAFSRAKAAGAVTLLDASQSLGHVPVRPRELGADLVAFTGHKGLHGPAGTGGLYVSPDVELQPVLVGGTGVRSDLELQPPEMPTRLEAGTPNVPGLAGLAAALRWHEAEGAEHRRRADGAARRLRGELRAIPGVRIFDDDDTAARVGIVSFRVDGWKVEETGYVLAESFGVICRTGLHCAPLIHDAIGSAPEGTVRFSVSGFTTDEEIETAVAAVRRLAA